jgi:hypothetical protein
MFAGLALIWTSVLGFFIPTLKGLDHASRTNKITPDVERGKLNAAFLSD